jgi:hypothetical protein
MIPGLINPNRSQTPSRVERENLIRQVNAETIGRPPGFWTSIILDAVAVLAAVASSWLYRGFLIGEASVVVLLIAVGVFSVVSVFQALLARSQSRRILILLLETIALVGFFYDLPLKYLAPVAAGGFLFFFWGEIATEREVENSLEIKFFSAIKPQLNRIITALSLLAVLLYLPQWNAEQSFLSRKTFDGAYVWATNLVHNFYGELRFQGSIGEFAESFVRFQYAGNNTFNQLLPAAQDKIVSDARAQVLSDLEAKAKIQVNESDPANLVAYRYFIQQFNNWKETFGAKFLLAWALIAFLVLRGFGFLFYIVIGFLAYCTYQVLLATNVIKVVGESRMKEAIEYS